MTTMTRADAQESIVERYGPQLSLLALAGIPGAGAMALVFGLQILRLVDGAWQPLPLMAELGSLFTVAVLFFVLRACLAQPSAPGGVYRAVLDFLAMERWHPAVKFAFAAMIVAPGAWYLHTSHWLIMMFQILGPQRALKSGDVRDALDGITALYQLTLTGGVPLLFVVHMISRWKPKNAFLPWLLMPLVFFGTAVGVVLLVFISH